MAALSFLDLDNKVTEDVLVLLDYFAKDTTERILRNVQRLRVSDTGALQSSIHATVYNNAGGNDALVRFYYLNYAGYLEQGLGHIRGVDNDLNEWTKSGKVKVHGVKAQNVRPIDAISGSEFGAIPATIRKATRNPKGDARRGEVHKAKPFLHSEIRLHLKATQRRLAMTLAYTATAYLTRGMVEGMMQLVKDEKAVSKWKENASMRGDDWSRSEAQNQKEWYGFRFVSDMGKEEAWLEAKGYLKRIEKEWGVKSFRGDLLK